MSDDNFEGPDAPVTITLKGGAGFEAPWLVLRATSAEDAIALLAESTLAELPEKIAEFAADFRGKAGAAPASGSAAGARTSGPQASRSARPSTPGGRGATRGAAPQQSQQQSAPADDVEYHPEGLICGASNCGLPVQLKVGTSKAGRQYEVWTCPSQRSKGDGHFSQYA